jgi:hypothetical protein
LADPIHRFDTEALVAIHSTESTTVV